MKIKFYIVTYNRFNELNKTLESLFNTDINKYNVEIFIINNHSNFKINELYLNKVKVIHNTLRPDFSTGHLSRNYNEIFLHGIKDLDNPDCDILIHSHDDNLFKLTLFSELIEYHKKYSFITFSWGCGFCSYLPIAIKKIGMWDERFCTIGYHEGDYFLRALKYNNEHTSINDWHAARRIHNPISDALCFKQSDTEQNDSHKKSFSNYSICRRLFELKWKDWRSTRNILEDTSFPINAPALNVPKPAIPTYMLYPYFEKKIENVEEKYYVDIDINGPAFF